MAETLTKTLALATILSTCAVYSAAASCESDNNRLLAEIQQVSNQAQSMGICQAARTLARIYTEAANLLRQCPTLDPTGRDASAYDQGASQAQQTASASCQ